MNLRKYLPSLLLLFMGILGSFLFAENQASQVSRQWTEVFSSHVEERSKVIKKILSGNQDYIQQAIDINKYGFDQKKPAITIKQTNKQNNDSSIIWNYYYQTVQELVLKHNSLCELIIVKQNKVCFQALSDRLTKYHIVIDEIGRDTFYQYHFYNWPDRLTMNGQPGLVVKVNVFNSLMKAINALSPDSIAVTIEEKTSGFSRQLISDDQVLLTSEKMTFRETFTQDGKQWVLKYSATDQYPHVLPSISKFNLFGVVITLLLSLLIALISHYIFQLHKLSKENLANIQKLTEINKVSGIGFWEWNIQTNHIYWSDEIYKIFDLKKNEEELSYDLFLSRVHPEDRVAVSEKVNTTLRNDEKYDIKHRILDSAGNVLHVHEKGTVTVDPAGKPTTMLGTVQDISLEENSKNKLIVSKSELKQAVRLKTQALDEINIELKQRLQENKKINQELLQERNRAQQYLDIANVILLVIDKTGNILLINKKGQEILGYTENELLGKNWFEQCIPESIRDTLQEKFYFYIENNKKFPAFYENKIITKQGELRSIAWENASLNSKYDESFAVISSGTDKTELKNSLELLGRKQQSLNTFFESDLIGVIYMSAQGIILSINPFVCSLTEYTRDELINKNFNILMPCNDDTSGWLQCHSSTRGNSFSLTLLNKNNQPVFTHIFLKPVINPAGKIQQFLCLVTDISEKTNESKRLLEQEKKHKKTLIREIHHRMKNHLQGVMGLIQNHELEHPESREILKKSRLQINSLAVTYGLQSSNENGEIYLCDILNASVKFSQQLLLASDQKMILSIPPGKPFLLMEGQAVSVSLVINELLLNAIKYSSQSATPILVSLSINEDKTALIKIENSGCQLPENFDYELNRGLGTGLELVKALMPEHMNLKINNIGSNVVAEFCLKKPLIAYSL